MARPNHSNGGRPKKPIDWREAEKLCALQCGEVEIADWFYVSVDTLARRLKDERGQSFKEFFTLHRVKGKIALRRNLFKLTERYPQAAIYCANNWLGMSDKQEVDWKGKLEVENADGAKEKLWKAISGNLEEPTARQTQAGPISAN